jgi:hypothetical protein
MPRRDDDEEDDFDDDDDRDIKRKKRKGGNSEAAGRLAGPAICLMVCTGLSLATYCIVTPIRIYQAMDLPDAFVPGGNKTAYMVGMIAGPVIIMALQAIVAVGAYQMKTLSSYRGAMTGTIISLIPCCSPCLLLGIPFGIWALIVLMDENVKSAFKS